MAPLRTKRLGRPEKTEIPTVRSAPERGEAPRDVERRTLQTQQIKLSALRLCELIVDAAPPSGRLTRALECIKTGVRLSLDEMEPTGPVPRK